MHRLAGVMVLLLGLPLAEEEEFRIGLLLEGVSGMTLEETGAELMRLLRIEGARADWRRAEQPLRGEPYGMVIVVRFKGDCRCAHEAAGQSGGGRLGFTLVCEGAFQPFVEVDCGQVRAALERSSPATAACPAVLGRALARGAAHEAHHIITGWAGHDGEGLSKAKLTSKDLAWEESGFSAAARERMARRR